MTADFWRDKRVLVTGGAGFVGSHVVDRLRESRRVPPDRIVVPRSRTHDLRLLETCLSVMDGVDVVLHLAADVGGMGYSRTHPASQYYNTTLLDLQVLEAARRAGVRKVVAVGSSTAYPATAASPLREEQLFDGLPYDAHLGYGYAKRALVIQARVFHRQHGLDVAVVVANNAYGPRDNFDRATSHVVPATIRKCLEDPRLVVWGDGSGRRDFLFVEDLAEGILLAAERLAGPGYVNLASGEEVTIKELVALVVELTGFTGEVAFDLDKPGGEARRVVSIDRARELIGFLPRWSLREGLARTLAWYRARPAHEERE
ncbi:MAG TPA: NAD-dependent epimerase/dehydratase family protein [Actinomycetota bacterium]|nr:NAD-dependent epimerase/dehydratase family protein [Actinomycetota bacterium]